MSTDHLLARPEDVLLAAVAYTRPQMLALDELIASQSAHKATLALPTELLLHIRSDLQHLLISQLAVEAAASLFEYESALVEGICSDCFWWNMDIYGSDVWTWVAHGYRGACACISSEPIPDSDSATRIGRPRSVSDVKLGFHSRSPSAAKRRILETFSGVEIETRGQWLRTYVSRTYFGDDGAWSETKRILGDLGCAHRFESVASGTPLSSHPTQLRSDDSHEDAASVIGTTATPSVAATGAPPAPTFAETIVAVNAPLRSELVKDASQRRASRPCDFGALVRIIQTPNDTQKTAERGPTATLNRLARELCLRPFGDDACELRIPLECSATRFVDQVYRRNACAAHFISQRHPESTCDDCMLASAATSGGHTHGSVFSSVFGWRISMLASTVAGAAGLAILALNGLSA